MDACHRNGSSLNNWMAGRTTIRLILMKLATEGMIRSEHGRGYFIIGASDGDGDPVSEQD
jgi:DNA-binding GntR family transcriptional regulator